MKKKNEVNLNDGTLEEAMADDFPRIYIHSMEDQPDGSCTMTFDTNKAFDNLYKKDKGRKRVSEKGIGNYILELFRKGLAKEDGYDLKPLKDIVKPATGCDFEKKLARVEKDVFRPTGCDYGIGG